MQIIFYKTDDDDKKIVKSLYDGLPIDIVLKRDTDVLKPSIKIDTSGITDLKDYNYCHIPELNRYYFINEIQTVNSVIVNVVCDVDVLMSYKDDILASKARLQRQLKNGDYMVTNIDKSYIANVEVYNGDVILPETPSNVLTTIGNIE